MKRAIAPLLAILLSLLGLSGPAVADTEDPGGEQQSIIQEGESSEASQQGTLTRRIDPGVMGSQTAVTCTVTWYAGARYNKPAGDEIIEEEGVAKLESDCTMPSMTADVYRAHHCVGNTFDDSDSDSGSDTSGPLRAVAYQEVPLFRGYPDIEYCGIGTEMSWVFEYYYTWPWGDDGCWQVRAEALYGEDIVFVGDGRQRVLEF